MSDLPVLLFSYVLGGTVFHAANNIGNQYIIHRRRIHPEFVTALNMAAAGLMGFMGSFLVYGWPEIRPGFWLPWLIVATLNVGIQHLINIARGLEHASIVDPLSATTPLMVVIATYFVVSERPTSAAAGIGIVVLAAGSYILRLEKHPVPLPRWVARLLPAPWHAPVAYGGGPWWRLGASRGAQLALAAACLASVALYFDKDVVLNSNPLFRTGATFFFVAIVVFGTSCWREVRQYLGEDRHVMGASAVVGSRLVALRRAFSGWLSKGGWQKIPSDSPMTPAILTTGIAHGAADALYCAGYTAPRGLVPYVGALKRVNIPLTIILARLFLKEGTGYFVQRIVGGTLIAIGAALLAF